MSERTYRALGLVRDLYRIISALSPTFFDREDANTNQARRLHCLPSLCQPSAIVLEDAGICAGCYPSFDVLNFASFGKQLSPDILYR